MASSPARTLSVTIDRPVHVVYAYVADPANMPAWSFLTAIERADDGDTWRATSEFGTVTMRFTEHNAHGVLDHFVRVSPELEVYVPMRAIANGTGTELLFTLFHTPDLTGEQFERDAQTVAADLERLKQLLESRTA